jgi:DNA gyrase subunit A
MTKKTEIEENILPQEMHEALDERFVTYAQMSLEDRALPDARDGLKPSQRRVLIAMNDLNLTHRAATVKCAKICGDTSGNYHPHGEAVVYPTMYRLAQDWIMRQPLLIGQGNFGNVDGDPPAAMRYTEAKMSIFGDLMLEDLAPDVVPFVPNYDEKRTEPVILPAKFPNLLVNGCAGIAVGWATSMPPHNLREVVAVVKAWIKNPKITSEEIMAIMPGPDFPTGGKILGKGEILEYYSTGHANLKLEGGYKIERGTKRDRIIINELPYQVGPEKVAKEIEQLVEAKTIQGIADLKNLSSKKTGIQLVIECQTGANVNVIVNNILKHTSLRSSFSVNQTVLAGKKVYPDVNISFLVKTFVEHRVEILTKKFQAELQRAKARIHILDGLISAVSHIKKVIDIVLNSTDAVKELIDSKIVETEIQANAVLAITLRQLTKLEREKLTKEKDELEDRCKWLKKVLGHRDEILSLIVQEQEELAQKYGNDRRTKITASTKDIDNEDLIKDEDLIISLTGDGYIKSVPISTFKVQGRGGKGVQGVADAAEEDVFEIFQSRSKSTLFFFTNTGLCFKRKAYEVPQCSRTAKGMHVSNMLDLKEG